MILLLLLLLLINCNGQLCTCAVDSYKSFNSPWTYPWGSENTPKCDIRMSMDCRHSIMWTYYLQNVFPNKISVMISINSIDNCTNNICSSNSFFFYSDRTNTYKDIGKTIIKTGDWYNSNTFFGNVSRITLYNNPFLFIRYKKLSLKIFDNYGMFPQGNMGFVRSGNYICSTAYSCSILYTKFNNGIGYGEYVHGTIDQSEEVPYWTCFYLHFQNNHVNICADPVNKKYARIHILLANNTYLEEQNEFIYYSLIPNLSWRSPHSKQIYFIDWTININLLNIVIHAIPTIKNSEFCIKDDCFWIGTTDLYINNYKVGIGITEIFNFTNPTSKKKLFNKFIK
jgi:hypothetical protein